MRSRSSSTAAARGRTGTTTRWRRTGPTRSSTRPPDRTPPSSTRPSTSRTGRAGRAWAATTRPSRSGELRPRPVLVPTHPRRGAASSGSLPGPLGPAGEGLQQRPAGADDEAPVARAVHVDGRQRARRAPSSPAARSSGPAVTAGFCGAVATVSSFVNLEAQTRLGAIAVIVGVRCCSSCDPRRAHPVAPGGSRPTCASGGPSASWSGRRASSTGATGSRWCRSG